MEELENAGVLIDDESTVEEADEELGWCAMGGGRKWFD